MSILVINAGSSSLKFGLFDDAAHASLATGLIDWTAQAGQAELVVRPSDGTERRTQVNVFENGAAVAQAIRGLVEAMGDKDRISVVGHRVVHGGERFRQSARIDANVEAGITELTELAPLHNPPALEAIRASQEALPRAAHVAVFDTAFFAHLPPRAFVYPLPYAWYTNWGVRRFGFHGISHAYCTIRATEMLSRPGTDLRLITCHLGNGCSATATKGGVPVATTMGFTPLEGLMMGTRSGSIDPGIFPYLQRRHGPSPDALEASLNYESGLLGVSGISSDYRQVEAAANAGHDRARLALDLYADRVRSTIGALAATLGGVDAVVFSAGVGEHSVSLREKACDGLHFMGIHLDQARNRACHPDMDIAAPDSPMRVLVIRTNEEQMIAREARRAAGNVAFE